MSWDGIGAVGELVGALGVIVSLVYLAAQIRQNSQVVRTATRQAVSTSQMEIGMQLASNPELRAAAARVPGPTRRAASPMRHSIR
jgi:hypothetical protein